MYLYQNEICRIVNNRAGFRINCLEIYPPARKATRSPSPLLSKEVLGTALSSIPLSSPWRLLLARNGFASVRD